MIRIRRTMGVVAACLALGACTTTVTGHPATAGSRTSGTPSSSPATVNDDAALHALLEAAPPGATNAGNAWETNEYPSVDQYLTTVWPRELQPDIRADLALQGIVDIVHRVWVAPDADQIDLILQRYRDDTGANGRFLSYRSILPRNTPDLIPVPGWDVDHLAVAQADRKTTGQYVKVTVLAWYGDRFLEAYYFSPGTLRTADLRSWIGAQLALLRSR